MKEFIVFVMIIGVSLAAPGLNSLLLARLNPPNAPVGADGRVIDTPEVLAAKAEHAAAQVNQRASLVNQEALTTQIHPEGAPIGPDGRVIDTPEVALAKAQHAGIHLAEKANQASVERSQPLLIALAPAHVSPFIKLVRRFQ